MNNYDLFARLLPHRQALLPTAKAALLANLALMVLALAQSSNCHLATLATVLPLAGQRENLIQRLRRWLKSRALSQRVYYLPLLKHLLAHWQGAELTLVMDRTDLNDRWSVLQLGIAFGQRVVPCGWLLLPFGSTSAEMQLKLLKQLQPYLPDPQRVRITLARCGRSPDRATVARSGDRPQPPRIIERIPCDRRLGGPVGPGAEHHLDLEAGRLPLLHPTVQLAPAIAAARVHAGTRDDLPPGDVGELDPGGAERGVGAGRRTPRRAEQTAVQIAVLDTEAKVRKRGRGSGRKPG